MEQVKKTAARKTKSAIDTLAEQTIAKKAAAKKPAAKPAAKRANTLSAALKAPAKSGMAIGKAEKQALRTPAAKPKKGFAAAKPVKKAKAAAVLKYQGHIIPVGRKLGDSGSNVPRLTLEGVSALSKLFAKLPKGCDWDATGSSFGVLNIYNKGGMLIAEVACK